MRLTPSKLNPLYELLEVIPDSGLLLDRDGVTSLILIFIDSGVFCESIHELYTLLEILEEKKLVYTVEGTLFKVKY